MKNDRVNNRLNSWQKKQPAVGACGIFLRPSTKFHRSASGRLQYRLVYFSLFVLDCAGDVVKLTLANDALAIQGSYAGYYKPSSVVNGKPSFKSGGNAIWFDDEYDDWNIGEVVDLGSDICSIPATKVVLKYTPGGARK